MWLDRCIAVVGSRRMTSYGLRVVEKIIPGLIQAGVTIVSGGMYGVDEAAHMECAKLGGRTIMVLGQGINCKDNQVRQLQAKVVEAGGVAISEWKEEKAQRWMFPYRNRLIVGMCQGVVVVEAGEKSGSLVTANLAIKWARQLMAMPGPVTSSVSVGTNKLIKEGKATLVMSGEEVLEVMGWTSTRFKNTDLGFKNKTSKIEKILKNEPLTVDELARKLNRPVEELGVELSMMELAGEIRQRNGRWELC